MKQARSPDTSRARQRPLLMRRAVAGSPGTARPARREISAGGVVFKKVGRNFRVCLIGKKRPNGSLAWCLPKGWVEKGEKAEVAAQREIREETGLEAKLIRRIQWIKYSYIHPEDKAWIFKIVDFFLFRYQRGSVRQHDWEVEEARWFSIEEAVKKASYPNEREVLRRARLILKRRQTQ